MKELANLSVLSRTRLGELVSAYIEPGVDFTINKKGELDTSEGKTFLEKVFGTEKNRMDFMEVTKAIMTKILMTKGAIPYVVQLCNDALGILMLSNKRDEVIDNIFIAHLVKEQPESIEPRRQGNPRQQDITIQMEQRMTKTTRGEEILIYTPQHNSQKLSDDVAEILNRMNGNVVFVKD